MLLLLLTKCLLKHIYKTSLRPDFVLPTQPLASGPWQHRTCLAISFLPHNNSAAMQMLALLPAHGVW